jgi:glycosyltransferase involved in cell wall biosynthesis
VHVLYLSQYFPPEVGATQARSHDLARGLVRAGHRVSVICEIPNHPSGIVPPAYRGGWYRREELDGIDVVRVWVKAAPVKTFSSRMLFYTSYMAMAVAAGLRPVGAAYDLVYATSPPLPAGAAGAILGRLRRVPFVLEVRDPWPAAAIALGELRSRVLVGLARALERHCYRRARRVVTLTRSWRDHLLELGVPRDKIVLIPNGANTELFHPEPGAAAALRASLGLENAFVVLYAGLHGIAQGLEVVLDAARRLEALPDVRFVLVGEGPVKAGLVARAEQLAVPNVLFLPEAPRARMPAFFSMANVTLVPLRKVPLLGGALPSKIFEAWACACPILLAGEGESRQLVLEGRGGVCVEPENGRELADALTRLRTDGEECRQMGRNGYDFVRACYDRTVLTERLRASLEDVLSEAGLPRSRQGGRHLVRDAEPRAGDPPARRTPWL